MTSTRILAIVLALTATSGSRLSSQSELADSLDRATLRGLRGFFVLVEGLPEDAARSGLTRNQLQTDVELRLREEDIRVFALEESSRSDAATLYLNVNVLKASSDQYLLSIGLSVQQWGQLERNPRIHCNCTTWQAVSLLGATGADNLSSFVRSNVRDKVNELVNAFLAVNPRSTH